VQTWAAALFRTTSRDAAVLGAALGHGLLVVLVLAAVAALPGALVVRVGAVAIIALGTCWGSNTVAHIHLHSPLFRGAGANRLFSLYLSALLGIPQAWWKRRHLWHHAGEPADRRPRPTPAALGLADLGVIAVVWAVLAAASPATFLGVVVPAWVVGLALCALQGHFEHARGRAGGIDYHGRIYNLLWFNDGHHVQHHRRPAAHWTSLPTGRPAAAISAYPPLLRWIEELAPTALDLLERWTMGWARLRAFMVTRHRRAFAALLALPDLPTPQRVCIVGGGIFPRSLLALAPLLPRTAAVTVVDGCARNLALARRVIAGERALPRVTFLHETFDPARPPPCDLLVLPLAYRGDRSAVYDAAPAPLMIVHDWLWRPRGTAGRRVSWLLLKRMNLLLGVTPEAVRVTAPTHGPRLSLGK
jgi:hypothetical protein